MRAFLRLATVTAAAGLLLAPVASAASASATTHHRAPHHQVPLLGGTTKVTTARGIAGALLGAGIVPIATAPGTEALVGGTAVRFAFPVTGGHVGTGSPPTGKITHAGGIRFFNLGNGHTVKVSRFTISLGAKSLTGIVNNDPHARVKIFNLDFSHARIHIHGHSVTASGIGLILSAGAAHALDVALGTTVFKPGLKVGNARTSLHI